MTKNHISCENYFCVYENNGFCILNNIELDIQGLCKDCVYINIDDSLLEKLKNKTLENLKFYE